MGLHSGTKRILRKLLDSQRQESAKRDSSSSPTGLSDSIALAVLEPAQAHKRDAELDFSHWFSPLWYTNRYPDVKEAGADPLGHYLEYGWRAGRDPSGSFSTRWYLAQNPDVAETDLNPLIHFLRSGRSERRQPHPLIKLPDYLPTRTAIVVLSFNAPEALRVTLDSLVRAKNVTPFTVFLVENGSGDETKSVAAEAARQVAEGGLDIRYIELPDNLGFSGGNNLGIRKALTENFTHICLLNSDVVCTTGWLDRLIATGEPVVGPVSNAVGNEQTIVVNYTVAIDKSAFDIVDNFARRWAANFQPALIRTDFLGFFCVLFTRSVIDRIGYLDERFSPGGYEDDDYCLRLAQAGFEMTIARHVYVHHFGSSSFSSLQLSDRIEIGNKNRRKFEEKWERPWSDRTHLPFLSAEQDADRFQPSTEQEALLGAMLRGLACHYRNEIEVRDREIRNLQTLLVDTGDPTLREAGRGTYPRRIGFGSKVEDLSKALPVEMRAAYTRLLFAIWLGLHDGESVSADILQGIQPVVFELGRIFASGIPILVLAGLAAADPITADERDGYSQRVITVDSALADCPRIYLRVDESRRGNPAIVQLMPDLWRLDIADRDALGEAILRAVIGGARGVYVHSLFGIAARSVRESLTHRTGKLLLDLHGVVPEEYELYDDPFNAQLFDSWEAEIARELDHLICVSSRMAEHFVAKHNVLRNEPIICPAFSDTQPTKSEGRIYNSRPCAIYAGGTAKWQQIGKMIDLIASARDHADFLILSPDPEVIARELMRHSLRPNSPGIISRSATHAEVLKAYERCDFGILLRDGSVVNRVACPTKLLEYLAFGLIPVLDSTQVGDVVDLGMAFVDCDTFRRGEIPSITERHRMILTNFSVLARLRRQWKDGLDKISRALARPSSQSESPTMRLALHDYHDIVGQR
jgi:GT2 family glycosyltransferase